jgi:hypothetical protein
MQNNYARLTKRFGTGTADEGGTKNPDLDDFNLILLARIADNLDRLATAQEQGQGAESQPKKVAKQAGGEVQ